jgi:hypothetical protein
MLTRRLRSRRVQPASGDGTRAAPPIWAVIRRLVPPVCHSYLAYVRGVQELPVLTLPPVSMAGIMRCLANEAIAG